ncbi:hypothetical protein SRHO_G00343670 [Serrasalmus rhombeus]
MRGYHVRYLKDPQTQIGHATIFIRPLQRNLSLEPICQPECSSELNGPPQKCVTCGEEFPFSQIKSEECTRLSQLSAEVQVEVASASASRPKNEGRCLSTRPQESQAARARDTDVSQENMPAPVTPQGHVPTPQIIDLDLTEEEDYHVGPFQLVDDKYRLRSLNFLSTCSLHQIS